MLLFPNLLACDVREEREGILEGKGEVETCEQRYTDRGWRTATVKRKRRMRQMQILLARSRMTWNTKLLGQTHFASDRSN